MTDIGPGDGAAIRADIRDLRQDLTSRMDQMVTRREHEAEVRRIDAEALAAREALGRHEQEADRRLTEIERAVAAGDAKILAVIEADRAAHAQQREDDTKERATAKRQRAEQRKADRRWMIGAVIAASGVIIAAGQLLRVIF